MAGDHVQITGTVIKAQGNGRFLVESEVTAGHILSCTLSGKIRQHTIRITEGDKVEVSASPYDLSRGIITFRLDTK